MEEMDLESLKESVDRIKKEANRLKAEYINGHPDVQMYIKKQAEARQSSPRLTEKQKGCRMGIDSEDCTCDLRE